MSNVHAAFFVGAGTLSNRLICWRTSSPASHVALLINGVLYSSCPGIGVCAQQFTPSADWQTVELPGINSAPVLDFFRQTRGAPYDWLAVLIGQTLAVKVRDDGAWFCSEWCAAALGMRESWRYSPGLLMNVVMDATAAAGRLALGGSHG